VFLLRPSGWFPADAWGSGPTEERIAALASEVAGSTRTVYLAEEGEGRAGAAEDLREAGVETVIPLGEAGVRRGIAVLGSAPEPLSSRDREFLDTLAAHTVTGLAWVEAAEQIAHASAVARGGFLAASLTHDLGKPINNIWSVARSALKPGRTADEVRKRLEEIQEFADQALVIVDRLFVRAQARAAGTPSRPLGEVVTLACQEAERAHGHPVVASFHGVMPDVECDFELSQALAALLGNACRESPEEAPVEVAVTVSARGGIRIEVADSGPGMDEETKARAFEPWFTKRESEGGRGLGLALCRLLVRQLGGEVEIAMSEPGKGTRMRILLPASITAEGGT
jgi:signal transduction histidine kinase